MPISNLENVDSPATVVSAPVSVRRILNVPRPGVAVNRKCRPKASENLTVMSLARVMRSLRSSPENWASTPV